MTETVIEWTPNKLAQLKSAYRKALRADKGNDDTFTFEGNELVVGYAKYLIEYLETQFTPKETK